MDSQSQRLSSKGGASARAILLVAWWASAAVLVYADEAVYDAQWFADWISTHEIYADIDGDGETDAFVLLLSRAEGPVKGGYAQPHAPGLAAATLEFRATDINGDGWLDLLAGHEQEDGSFAFGHRAAWVSRDGRHVLHTGSGLPGNAYAESAKKMGSGRG